ncbi:unnamed protein product [Pleuronectes platessa]|uniref:Uncharacterized protein n=1 Tax=Pleuronectes platessa TaxID=8262 RepID=A0A9N7YHR3_PLEPL|nr:unnamed protein product [Pleuronectes platessa]
MWTCGLACLKTTGTSGAVGLVQADMLETRESLSRAKRKRQRETGPPQVPDSQSSAPEPPVCVQREAQSEAQRKLTVKLTVKLRVKLTVKLLQLVSGERKRPNSSQRTSPSCS